MRPEPGGKTHEQGHRRTDAAQSGLRRLGAEFATSSVSTKFWRRIFTAPTPTRPWSTAPHFSSRPAIPVKIKNLMAEDVKIRVLGDFAIIHARYQLHHGGWTAGLWPLHRLLGPAERPLAGGVGACGAVTLTSVHSRRRAIAPSAEPIAMSSVCALRHNFETRAGLRIAACIDAAELTTHASNMITLRTVLPAFIAAKPSLISESFSLAEIQSSRCSLPRM